MPAKKGNWIRSQPRDLPFKELEKRAKSDGIGTISQAYVQKVRSSMPKPRNSHSNGRDHHEPLTPLSNSSDGDPTYGAQFLKIVRVIGTERARKMLEIYENGS